MDKRIIRERRKRFAAILIALLMLFSMLPVGAMAYNCGSHNFGSTNDPNSADKTIGPTCTEPGYYVYYCKNKAPEPSEGDNSAEPKGTPCEGVEKVPFGSKLGHTFPDGSYHEAVPATCNKKGQIAYYECDQCHEKFASKDSTVPLKSVETDVDGSNHNCTDALHHAEEPATCVSTGVKEYWECEWCRHKFTSKDAIEEIQNTTIPVDPDNHDMKNVAAQEATCTEPGWEAYQYCARENCNYTTKKEISPKNHKWGEISYEWTKDNSTCTATRVCENDAEHVETETVSTTHTDDTATCTEAGQIVYTAAFTKYPVFGTKTKDVTTSALNHKWGEISYEWAKDNSTCTATRVCENDAEHVETETVKTTHTDDTATCTEAGQIVYTAAFTKYPVFGTKTKEVTTSALKHDWGEPVYVWADDHSKVTATRVCKRNPDHKETDEAVLDTTVVVDPTCKKEGSITYTSKGFKNPAFTVQTDVVTTAVDKDAHDWGEPVYVWADDHSKVTATRICKGDPEHKETDEAALDTTVVADPTCTAEGNITYTSKAFKNAAFTVQTDVVKTEINPDAHEWDEGKITKAPDCTNKGEKTYTCKLNKSHTKKEDIPADKDAHDWDEGIITKVPDCTNKGEKTYTCMLNKSHTKTEELPVDEDAHDWGEPVYVWADDHSKVTATRVCKGDPAHKETDEAELDTTVVTDPTCTAEGSTTYTSKAFKNAAFTVQTDVVKTEINPDAHEWDEGKITKAPDCTNKGEKTYTCKLNKSHTKKEDIPADKDAHDWDEGEITKAPDCVNKGEKTYTCKLDRNHTKTEELPVDEDAHDWGKPVYVWAEDYSEVTATRVCTRDAEHRETETVKLEKQDVQAATCMKTGKITYTSKAFENEAFRAQTKVVTIEIDKDAHDWGKVSYTWAKDYSEVRAERVCKRNAEHKETETVTLDKQTIQAGTCTEAGKITYISSAFKNKAFTVQTAAVETETDPEAHDWDDGEVTTAPNCTNKGVMTYTCKLNPEHTRTEEIPVDPEAHDWDDGEVTAVPDCTNKGEMTYTCRLNPEHMKTEEIEPDPEAHEWDEGELTTAPDCTNKGVMTYTCRLNPEHTKTEETETDPEAHDWDEGELMTAPDCTNKGVMTYTCRLNPEHTKTEEIGPDPDAHTWDGGELTTAPDCTNKGVITYTCLLNSEHTKTEETETDPDAHDWGEPVYTWSEDNTQVTATRTCKRNADHQETETAAAAGTVTVEPTHDDNGQTTYTATFDNPAFETQTKTVETDPVGHRMKYHEAVQPTTESEGRKEYWECIDCGEIFEDENGEKPTTQEALMIPMPELMHHPQIDPTCDGEGVKEYWEDTTTGKKYADPKGTTEITDAELTIEKLDHIYEDDWTVVQKPTLVHPGLEKRTCERDGCGEEEYREIPAEGKVGQQHTVGNFTLTITDLETRTVSITGWNGTEEEGEELTLPDTVDIGGYEFTVTGISAGAFAGNGMLQKLILGEKVEVIDQEAFRDCKRLTVVNAMKCENLRTVGESAFEGCEVLDTVLMNITSLETLEPNVFTGIAENAAFSVFCLDAQKLLEAKAMLQTEETGWLETMTLEGYQYFDDKFEEFNRIDEGTLVINKEIVGAP